MLRLPWAPVPPLPLSLVRPLGPRPGVGMGLRVARPCFPPTWALGLSFLGPALGGALHQATCSGEAWNTSNHRDPYKTGSLPRVVALATLLSRLALST